MQDDALETSTYLYDFRETSSSSHARVVKTVEKSSFSDKDYTGLLPLHASAAASDAAFLSNLHACSNQHLPDPINIQVEQAVQ